MPFNCRIPLAGGRVLEASIPEGKVLFVLGANGAGKSSLMHEISRQHHANSRRISAHRQNWLQSSMVGLTPEQKVSHEVNAASHDLQLHSRWRDDYSGSRGNMAIMDLIDAENTRAREIARAIDGGNVEAATQRSASKAPISWINEILKAANLEVSIDIENNSKLVASKRDGGNYGIAEMSDGERNSVLVAATTLTVKSGSLLIIDEPERHLHRSIITPLLSSLFRFRPDCAFLVSTHEVNLPLDFIESSSVLLRGCTYNEGSPAYWDADLISSGTEIDETLKRDILGARRKMLFIEGTESSLDKPLYSLLFPNVSIVPKASCRDVEQAVIGIRAAGDLHWLQAFGIVDNDWRSQENIDRLRQNGVFALAVHSVESVYYHPDVQKAVATRHANITGEDAVAWPDPERGSMGYGRVGPCSGAPGWACRWAG